MFYSPVDQQNTTHSTPCGCGTLSSWTTQRISTTYISREAGMGNESTRFDEFVDKRFTWFPVYNGDGEPDSKPPGIGILRDDENDPDKAMHIFHIIVGAFVVHLVGEKDAEHFDRLANELKEMKWGLLFEAGHIHILADLEEEHTVPPPY
jgi:hypothetical protein